MGNVIAIRGTGPLTKAKREALIDEFGQLQQKIDAHKPTKQRHEQLRDQIAGWYDSEPADKPFLEDGHHFTLEVSEKANKRTIVKMAALFKMLGQKLFLSLCSFPLAAVDTNVPQPRHKEFLTEEQSGARKLKVLAKLPAVLEEAA